MTASIRPWRFSVVPAIICYNPEGHGGLYKEIWDNAVRPYYELMGWDPDTGYPLDATLNEVGLEHLVGQ